MRNLRVDHRTAAGHRLDLHQAKGLRARVRRKPQRRRGEVAQLMGPNLVQAGAPPTPELAIEEARRTKETLTGTQ